MAHRLSSYLALLAELETDGFSFHPIAAYFEGRGRPPDVYLRHDVDRLPARAVAMAEEEAAMGVASTYYFRCDRSGRFPRRAVERVAALSHEIGFHYECLSRTGGDVSRALERFRGELAGLRELAAVLTVAPHGAPGSQHSNMAFAHAIQLNGFDLLGDASAIEFTDMLYITDTGGTFGSRHNRRDRPPPGGRMLAEAVPPEDLAARLRQEGETRIVLSCHPERWPESTTGLVQASLRDALANLAKIAIRRYQERDFS